jgi:hypothetical protein|tara:strand:+ start:1321 stop:1464 length:144 start_codon:yes stop_codon:yes gene_type:complete
MLFNPNKFVEEPFLGPIIFVLVDEREAHPLKPLYVNGISGIDTVIKD